MNKIIGFIFLAMIGILYGGVLLLTYGISLIYLFFSEIIGTKKFNVRFKRLNKIIYDEFKDIIKAFKELFEVA